MKQNNEQSSAFLQFLTLNIPTMDMSDYHMKAKVFQLWHLWQVVTLEDIFSYFTMEKLLYALVVKNISLCMHIFLFREGTSLLNVIIMENVALHS